jgi:2-(1,2-epoxy-1,2-dihydrophenyl)acetyl-CoA isomerase
MSDCIVETTDGVKLIRFNRPEAMNSLGGTLLPEFIAAFEEGKRDDRVRAFVVTGEGRAWCAGADLVGMNRRGEGGAQEERHDRRFQSLDAIGAVGRAVLSIYECDKPTIAAVNGAAAGGGFGLCSTFDIRIASDRARFTTAFMKLALSSDCGLSWFLPRLIGPEKAAEMFYTSRIVEADEALTLGIVSRVVPHESLLEHTMDFARELARKPPTAMTYTRRALQAAQNLTLEQHLDLEWTSQTKCLAAPEFKEGVAAFVEKRAPDFSKF